MTYIDIWYHGHGLCVTRLLSSASAQAPWEHCGGCVRKCWMDGNGDYPLVNVHIAMENHHFLWENPLFQWPFSIAMLNYQRVISDFRGFPNIWRHAHVFVCSILGQPWSASPSAQLQGEKYEILAVLGSGSFGEVREVAWWKFCRTRLISTGWGVSLCIQTSMLFHLLPSGFFYLATEHRCPFPIGWLINRGVCLPL